jgi:hypothetical protein
MNRGPELRTRDLSIRIEVGEEILEGRANNGVAGVSGDVK